MGCRYLIIGDMSVSVLNKNIELAKKFMGFSHRILWKNPNELLANSIPLTELRVGERVEL